MKNLSLVILYLLAMHYTLVATKQPGIWIPVALIVIALVGAWMTAAAIKKDKSL